MRLRLNKRESDVDRALRRLVAHAYATVPIYRQTFDEAGVVPASIRRTADLPRLPIVTKEWLTRSGSLTDSLRRGASVNRSRRVGTSGSTGIPVNVYMSRSESAYRRLLLWQAWRRLAPLTLPLSVVDVGSWIESGAAIDVTHRGPVRLARISIALPPEDQATAIRRFRPQVISGYPTALDILATEGDLSGCRPRLVACRGEVLAPDVRRTLEQTFRARVADFYNAEEIGNIAWECPADPAVLHVNTDSCVVEVVDGAGRRVRDGVEGRILATNLYNWTMPFVRYALGDRGALDSEPEHACSCGSRAPRLTCLSGREDDYVVLPGGRRVSPRLVATAVNRAFAGLTPQGPFDRHFRRFRILQDRLDHVRIDIVPEPGVRPEYAAIIRPALAKIHPALSCTVNVVDRLDPDPSGKYRKVVSAVSPASRPADPT